MAVHPKIMKGAEGRESKSPRRLLRCRALALLPTPREQTRSVGDNACYKAIDTDMIKTTKREKGQRVHGTFAMTVEIEVRTRRHNQHKERTKGRLDAKWSDHAHS